MVGAPGYSSGRSVLVVIPNSEAVVRASDLATVWAVFEKAGVLTTFATLDSSGPSIESEDGVLIPENAQHRLEVRLLVPRARSPPRSRYTTIAASSGSNIGCGGPAVDCHDIMIYMKGRDVLPYRSRDLNALSDSTGNPTLWWVLPCKCCSSHPPESLLAWVFAEMYFPAPQSAPASCPLAR